MSSLNYLIIGGDGFLGRWVVELLLRRNKDPGFPIKCSISIFDLQQRYFDRELTYYTGDLANYVDIASTIKKSQPNVVIDTASPPHGLGAVELYWKVNVEGTKNLLKACIENGVERLVFTSSAGVLYDGIGDLIDVDEKAPFPIKFHDAYNETKAEAERLVLSANGQHGLFTCVIRPSGLFGPRDKQAIPNMIQVMEQGQMNFQIGDNFNLFDWTYIENAAHAHLLAADKLTKGGVACGQVFLITNGTPIPFWDMPRFIWSQFNSYPKYIIKMPRTMGLCVAYFAEWASYLLKKEEGFTRYRVKYATSQRYFNITKAKTLLGYVPLVDLEEGIRRSCEYFVQEARKQGKIK